MYSNAIQRSSKRILSKADWRQGLAKLNAFSAVALFRSSIAFVCDGRRMACTIGCQDFRLNTICQIECEMRWIEYDVVGGLIERRS